MSMKKVGLILNGTRDCWIAEALAQKDIDVLVYDQSHSNAGSILSQVELILDRKLSKWAITQSEKKVILSHIKLTADLDSFQQVDLLIEASGEQLEEKKELLGKLDQLFPQDRIIATHTCIHRVSELACGIAHPQRVIGLHFLDELVEIIPGERTSESTLDVATQFVEKIGKAGIRVADECGLVSIRLMLPLMNEASAMLMENQATAEEIDQAMKKGFGFKYGPFETVDRMGADYILLVMEQLFERTGEDKYRPSEWIASRARTLQGESVSLNGQEEVQA